MPVSAVERPVSAERQCMLEDMVIRGLRSDTHHDYVRVVRSFAAFLAISAKRMARTIESITFSREGRHIGTVHARGVNACIPPMSSRLISIRSAPVRCLVCIR